MVCLEEQLRRAGSGMMHLNLGGAPTGHLNILCLGAHSDDIEIGCGGTLLELRQSGIALRVYWVVFSAAGKRGEEARASAEVFTAGCETELVVKEFRDGFLPFCAIEVKEFFENLKGQTDPDLIFTHWQGDAHQDHRFISELTWNTFRNHLILEYEIPKYDGDMGRPNIFMPLGEASFQGKVGNLIDAFGSQRSKRWFSPETFLGLMRIRGMECNSPTGYAEAFYSRKITLNALNRNQMTR
jgi:LmbE family N-acetylglucosaminyl deacetylase